jgi:hypothetical protein
MTQHLYRNSKVFETWAGTTQPYMHMMTIISPLIALTFSIYLVSFQLLHFSFARAVTVQQPVALQGTLPPILSTSHMVTTVSTQLHINLSIGLRPRNPTLLQQTTHDLFDQKIAQQQAIAPSYYIEQFSPDARLYAHLSHYLTRAGFTITHTYPHRLLLDFSGTIAQAENLFHVQINTYVTSTGQYYVSNNAPPLLPAWLAAQTVSINGLSTTLHWQHSPIQTQPSTTYTHPKRQSPLSSACPHDAIQRQQLDNHEPLHRLYQAHYQGANQDIALFELLQHPDPETGDAIRTRPTITGQSATSTQQQQDIMAYTACSGQQKTQLSRANNATTPASGVDSLTTTADADVLLHTLPQLHALTIYTTDNDEVHYLSQWAQIIQDATPVVATNWGLCESQIPLQVLQQEYYFFQMAALQGQNILASTDNGSGCPAAHTTTAAAISTGILDPAAQPFIIAIGGPTQLAGQTNTPATLSSDKTVATNGGGISRYWLMPDWQHSSGVPGIPDARNAAAHPCKALNNATGYCRAVPDVALTTNTPTDYWIYCSSTTQCDPVHPWTRISGPTTAVPQWAALLALASEMVRQHNDTWRGFLAPYLYRVASDPIAYAASFHDVSAGHSPHANNIGQAFTTTGYDLATGLGGSDAWSLAQHLLSLLNQNLYHLHSTRLSIHAHPE